MLDSNTRLSILLDKNGTFTDLSDSAWDYTRDTFNLTINSTTDYLYIGYTKPINAIYIDMSTPNTNANTLTIEYYNGSNWTVIDPLFDETKGMTRSGFIHWDRNLTDQDENVVNSTTKYWVRVRPDTGHSAITCNGINLLFSCDNELRTVVYEITDSNHLTGKSSHLLTHVGSRNYIIQEFKNKGYVKTNSSGVKSSINIWDLHDVGEIKQASIFKTLSTIYDNFSDEPNDIYSVKSKSYQRKYEKQIELAKLSFDKDDDGLLDTDERVSETRNVRISR